MKQKYIVTSFLILLVFSSCGIITKARYGNGLKLNLEIGKDNERELSQKSVKVKKTRPLKQDTSIHLTMTEPAYFNDPTDAPIINSGIRDEIKSAHRFFQNNKIKSHNNRNNHWNKTKSVHEKVQSKEKPKAPVEPNSKAAGYLFYGSILISIILSVLGIAVPVISVILFLAWLLGLILAFVGLKKIKQSGDKFRGYGLDLSIIILGILSVILTIGSIALAAALL